MQYSCMAYPPVNIIVAIKLRYDAAVDAMKVQHVNVTMCFIVFTGRLLFIWLGLMAVRVISSLMADVAYKRAVAIVSWVTFESLNIRDCEICLASGVYDEPGCSVRSATIRHYGSAQGRHRHCETVAQREIIEGGSTLCMVSKGEKLTKTRLNECRRSNYLSHRK